MQTSYFWEHQLHFANAKTIVFANDLSKNHIFYFHRTVNSNHTQNTYSLNTGLAKGRAVVKGYHHGPFCT